MRKLLQGFSLIELLIVVAIMLILAAVTLPYMNQQLLLAHETAAIRMIGTIQTVQAQYHAQYGRFAVSMAELGPPVGGQPGPGGAALISREFATGKKDGYVFRVEATPTGYVVHANPVSFGGSGRRSFYSDETLVVRQNWGPEEATSQSPELQG